MTISRLTWLSIPLATIFTLSSCSPETLSCGQGTEEKGDECVVAGNGGSGPDDSDAEDTGDGDGKVIIVDRDGRSDTQKRVEEEFEGAIAAAPVSSDTVTVVWKSLDVVGLTYHIYIAQDEDALSFGSPQAVAPQGATDWTFPGLKEGKKYYIAVVPVLEGVELDVAHDAVVVTPRDDDEGPAFTGLRKGKAIDNAGVNLSWEAANDDYSPSETIRYEVYFGSSDDFIKGDKALNVPLAISPRGATSMNVYGLPLPETEYFFLVRAVDAAGNKDDNGETKAVTTGKDKEAPVFAGCSQADAQTASVIKVHWEPARDNLAAADDIIYNFYVSKTEDFNFAEPTYQVTGGTYADIPGLERDESYYIVCRAEDPSGNQEENERIQSAKTKSDELPPEFDGVGTPLNIGANSVEVIWQEAEDNQSPPEAITYILRYSTEPGIERDGDGVIARNVVGETSIVLDELKSNTTYFARLSAMDEATVESDLGEEFEFTTLVSLRKDIEIPIFANKCATSNCHSGATPPHNLNLSLGWSYGKTVNIVSGSNPSSTLVVPGDPDNSHLVKRIESTDPAFKMPQDQDIFLSAKEIQTIRTWITQGALEN